MGETRRGIPLREHAVIESAGNRRWRCTVPWSEHVTEVTADDLDGAHRAFGLAYMQVLQLDAAERDRLGEYLRQHGG